MKCPQNYFQVHNISKHSLKHCPYNKNQKIENYLFFDDFRSFLPLKLYRIMFEIEYLKNKIFSQKVDV